MVQEIPDREGELSRSVSTYHSTVYRAQPMKIRVFPRLLWGRASSCTHEPATYLQPNKRPVTRRGKLPEPLPPQVALTLFFLHNNANVIIIQREGKWMGSTLKQFARSSA